MLHGNTVANGQNFKEMKEKLMISIKICDDEVNVLKEQSKTTKEQLKKVKTSINSTEKARTDCVDSTDTKLKRELTRRGIYLEVHHGGTLTGNNCKKLCADTKDFVKIAYEICEAKRKENERSGNVPTDTMTKEKLLETFNLFRQILKLTDVVFANLNLICPTEKEMKETERYVSVLGEMWIKTYGVTYTPKVHSLLGHACECQRRFGGLGDKTEQNIEKRHQLQKMMSHRLVRLSRDFNARLRKQMEYEWRRRHPRVTRIMVNVDNPIRKRKDCDLTLKEENANKRRSTKEVARMKFVKTLFAELEKEQDVCGETENVGVAEEIVD